MENSINKEINKAIEDQRVFYTRVSAINPAGKGRPLTVPVNVQLVTGGGTVMKGIIYGEDLDENSHSGNFTYLIGRTIPFVIKGFDETTGILICSRVMGVEKVKEQMRENMRNDRIFEGVITGFHEFGAFVDVNGVMGILKNTDYSTDYSRISERLKVGDHISVKCKSCDRRVAWEAAKKYQRTEPIVCNFEPGAVILGRIVDIKDFPQGIGAFVQINDQKELDVLCGIPAELEVEKGVSVIVRITSVNYPENELEKPKLRGAILRVA